MSDLIFAPDSTPLFGAVSTGMFGRRTSLVPLHQASLTPDHVTIPYDKDTVKNAPQLANSGEMSGQIEDATADHYAIPRRARTMEDVYVSAEDRARRAEEEARQAEQYAAELEQRADALEAQVHDARATMITAQRRLDDLIADHRDAVEQARQLSELRSPRYLNRRTSRAPMPAVHWAARTAG